MFWAFPKPHSLLLQAVQNFQKSVKALVPYTDGGFIDWIHGRCEIIKEEHRAEGYVDEELENRLKKYQVN